MTLNYFWRSFQSIPMSDTSTQTESANKKSLDSFQVIRHWRCFKVGLIGLFYIKFLINGALCGKSYLQNTNRKSYISFRLVPLFMTSKDIWRSFQSRLRFVTDSCHLAMLHSAAIWLARLRDTSNFSNLWLHGFRVAPSLNNSWASCRFFLQPLPCTA